jgi:hypothetical protein
LAHAYSPRRNVARDLPLSLLVHGGLAAVVLSTRLSTPPTLDTRNAVLWLTVPELESPRATEPDVAVERSLEPLRDAPRSAPEPSRQDVATQPPEAASAEPTDADAPANAPPRPAIDWERARHEALNQLRGERERGYATFSADDFVAPPAPLGDPAPTGEIFAPNPHGPSLLALGEQHTRFGRKLADICHALTGGLGISFQGHALFSLCAAPGGRSDLFAAIKPDYLKLVPDCTSDLPREAAAQIPPLLVRCRLVAPADKSLAHAPE